MNQTPQPSSARLSVHKRRTKPPQPLREDQLRTLQHIGDVLIPALGDAPKASDSSKYPEYLELAVAARSDSFETLQILLDSLADLEADQLLSHLRQMSGGQPSVSNTGAVERRRELDDSAAPASNPDGFQLLSTIVAGAYFMTPENARRIGYPGQGRNVPKPTEAADDLDGDILDSVIARGPIYVSGVGE